MILTYVFKHSASKSIKNYVTNITITTTTAISTIIKRKYLSILVHRQLKGQGAGRVIFTLFTTVTCVFEVCPSSSHCTKYGMFQQWDPGSRDQVPFAGVVAILEDVEHAHAIVFCGWHRFLL